MDGVHDATADGASAMSGAPPAEGVGRLDRLWDALSGPATPPRTPKRVAATIGALAVAGLLTHFYWRLTGDLTIEFYLLACVAATWYGGLWVGLLAVAAASVLGFDGSLDSVSDWQVTHGAAWIRFAVLAGGAAAFALLWEALSRKKRARQAAVQHLRIVIDLAPAPIALAEDPACHYIRINGAMAATFGVSPGVIASPSGPVADRPNGFRFCRDGADVPGDQLPLQRAASTGRPTAREELQVVRDDGATVTMVGSAVPLFDEDGELTGSVGAFSDVTEARAIEAELRAANAVKDEFLGLVSHEMKTPITVIRGNAELLDRRRALVDEHSEAIAIHDIRVESERLSRIVDDLLTLSRLGLLELEREPLMLRRLIDRVVSEHRASQPARPIRASGDSPAVLAAPAAVEQVLTNLIANAERYTPAGSPIEVRVRALPGQAEVAVRDFGHGIPAGESERVFATFYRSAAREPAAGGIGIGLTVCRRLVEALDGHIGARQPPGRGTEVAFTLPLAPEEGP